MRSFSRPLAFLPGASCLGQLARPARKPNLDLVLTAAGRHAQAIRSRHSTGNNSYGIDADAFVYTFLIFIARSLRACDIERHSSNSTDRYTSVREKLDDPKYSSWFIKFRGFNNAPYPGGRGRAENVSGAYHVPPCDWYQYNSSSSPPACSGFWHDQKQSPEHPGYVPCTRKLVPRERPTCLYVQHLVRTLKSCSLCSGGSAYAKNLSANQIAGDCHEQCDCGGLNPCGECV